MGKRNFIVRFLPKAYVEERQKRSKASSVNRRSDEYRDLYTRMLEARGLAEIRAVSKDLSDRLEGFDDREKELLERIAEYLSAWKGSKTEREDDVEYISLNQELAVARFEREDAAIRISILDHLSNQYALFGLEGVGRVQTSIVTSALREEKWMKAETKERLYKSLSKRAGFLCGGVVASDEPWRWCGTQEQLVYMIYLLVKAELIESNHHWKSATGLISKSDGSLFRHDQLRSVSGNLGLSLGGACSTRADELESVVKAVASGSD